MQIENSDKPHGYIYKLTNPVNGKCYIGQTLDVPTIRWQHYKCLNCKDQPKLYNALKKYKPETFIYEIVCSTATDQQALDEQEIKYIIQFDSIRHGYNIKMGGGGGQHNNDTKRKISDSLERWYAANGTDHKRGSNNPMFGKHHSDQSLQKIREANKNKKLSIEHIQRLIKANTGKKNSPETIQKRIESRRGYYHSEETKKRISKSKKGLQTRLGAVLSQETRQRISESLRRRAAGRVSLVP
jgi:group I intron endonuclease